MDNERRKSRNPIDLLLNLCLVIVNFMLALLIVIVIADVIMTFFFDSPLKWSIEVSEYILGFITFLGTGWLMREEGHLRFDMVINLLPAKVRAVFEIFMSMVGLLVSSIVVWAGYHAVVNLYQRGALMESVLQWPRWILIMAVPLGFTIMALQLLRRTVDHMRKFKVLRSQS